MLRCENLARALAHAPAFHLPQFGVIWQLDMNREDYLGKYGWLRIEDDGARWYCWICHQYGGAKDKLGREKARPSRPEKLTDHAVNKSHIEAMKVHEANLKLKREKQLLEADESNTLFEKVDPRDLVTFTAVATCVKRKISPLQHAAAVVSLLREHGVACRREGRNSHLSPPSIGEILIQGAEL